MKKSDILTRLCYYDERNPDGTKDIEEIQFAKKEIKRGAQCGCDNCFYGRTAMAEDILDHISKTTIVAEMQIRLFMRTYLKINFEDEYMNDSIKLKGVEEKVEQLARDITWYTWET